MPDADAEVVKYLLRAKKIMKLVWPSTMSDDPATVAQIATLLKMVDICPYRDRKDG